MPDGSDVQDAAPAGDSDGEPAAGDGTPPDSGGSGLGSAIAGAVEALDDLVPDEPNAANSVLVPKSRYLPWIGMLFACCSVVLVPWIAYIALTLPQRELSPNYDIAWAGFDVMLLAATASTAWTVLRRSRWMAMASSWTAGLLVTDAWFDTVTAPRGWDLAQAIAMTLLVELPLAAICLWVAVHATEIAQQRVHVLLRRRRAAARR